MYKSRKKFRSRGKLALYVMYVTISCVHNSVPRGWEEQGSRARERSCYSSWKMCVSKQQNCHLTNRNRFSCFHKAVAMLACVAGARRGRGQGKSDACLSKGSAQEGGGGGSPQPTPRAPRSLFARIPLPLALLAPATQAMAM